MTDPTTPNEPGFPHLGVARDPERMAGVLRAHLRSPDGAAYDVLGCRALFVRDRAAGRAILQWSVRLADPATGRAWDRVVTGVAYGGGRTRRVWERLRRAAPAPAAVGDAPPLAPFAFVPELDLLLQVFPHDHGLPALARLTAGPPPELVPPILAGFGPGAWRPVGWDAEPVRYRPAIRAAVRLTVRAEDAATGRVAERRAYAKVYGDAERGRLGERAQRALHDRVAAGGAPFAVAEPIAYADGLRTLVQGEVGGTSLEALLRQPGDPTPTVRAAARAVAAFHRLDLAAPPRRARKEIPRPLREAQARLGAARPDLARGVAAILAGVAAGLGGAPPAPTHGDLKPHHVLVDGDRVALIDFDDLAEDDPLRDVANLVAQLALGRDEGRARAAVRAFLGEYVARVPDAWRARIPPAGP